MTAATLTKKIARSLKERTGKPHQACHRAITEGKWTHVIDEYVDDEPGLIDGATVVDLLMACRDDGVATSWRWPDTLTQERTAGSDSALDDPDVPDLTPQQVNLPDGMAEREWQNELERAFGTHDDHDLIGNGPAVVAEMRRRLVPVVLAGPRPEYRLPDTSAPDNVPDTEWYAGYLDVFNGMAADVLERAMDAADAPDGDQFTANLEEALYLYELNLRAFEEYLPDGFSGRLGYGRAIDNRPLSRLLYGYAEALHLGGHHDQAERVIDTLFWIGDARDWWNAAEMALAFQASRDRS